jgi:hypothetical protein
MDTSGESHEYLGCCACADGSPELIGGTSCADKQNVFTRREQSVLGKIREASLRARALKERIRYLTRSESSPVLLQEALDELDSLRRTRDDLETERIAAAEERMRMLGHL